MNPSNPTCVLSETPLFRLQPVNSVNRSLFSVPRNYKSMAELKGAHIVEIPVVDEERRRRPTSAALDRHPLAEISGSPGHLLVLKLWQREEDLVAHRVAAKETRMESSRREAFQLCCYFLCFHGLFLAILFTSTLESADHGRACRRWWFPAVLSGCTSLFLIILVHMKLRKYYMMSKRWGKERADGRALARCVQELRMKGSSFDLSKEPQSSKKMKSSSVEIKWKPITSCCQYLMTISLLCFAGLAFPASKLILCVW
ncbi:hypothetical protein NMG60_11037464 [Bertholletia excelsa]